MKTLEPGDPDRVGTYKLAGRLGSGGMGHVFLGQTPAGRLVAVKVIREELAADDTFRMRFAREVDSARKVSGLFTAPVIDADPYAQRPWLVTAYVAGPSLADAVTTHGPLSAASVLRLAAGLAEGLGAIHAAGVVHRDLKPSNVLLSSDGPQIIDFGISQAADATALTRTEMVIGSPAFISPEQAEGTRTGPASDVFSLGSVLAFAATGEGPFGTGPASALLYRVVHGQPALSGLPEELRSLLERCLAKEPEQRLTTKQILDEVGSHPLGTSWLPAGIGDALQTYQVPSPPAAWSAATVRSLEAVAPPAVASSATTPPPNAGHQATVGTVLHEPAVGTRRPRRLRYWAWAWVVAALAAVTFIAAVAAFTLTPRRADAIPPPSRRTAAPIIRASAIAAGQSSPSASACPGSSACPSPDDMHTPAALPCTASALTKAARAKQQLFGWRAIWHACGSGWAVAGGTSPSVGYGVVVLRQTPNGWTSHGLDDGFTLATVPGHLCHGLPGEAGLPPYPLLMALIQQAGLVVKGCGVGPP